MPALIFKFRRGKNDQFPKPMPIAGKITLYRFYIRKYVNKFFEEAKIIPDFHLLFPKMCIGVPAAVPYMYIVPASRWKDVQLQHLRT